MAELIDWVHDNRYDFYQAKLEFMIEQCPDRKAFERYALKVLSKYPDKEKIPKPIGFDYYKFDGEFARARHFVRAKKGFHSGFNRSYGAMVTGDRGGYEIGYDLNDVVAECTVHVKRWCLRSSCLPSKGAGYWVEYHGVYVLPLPELNGKQKVTMMEVRNCVKIIIKDEDIVLLAAII
jgi:hypothetical protein